MSDSTELLVEPFEFMDDDDLTEGRTMRERPTTEAGRRVWQEKPIGWTGQDWRAAILAIEAEAAQGAAPLYIPDARERVLDPAVAAIAARLDLREQLAALEHEQWEHWSRTVAEQGLTPERIERWERYWVPYADLDEATKDFDREWADKALALIEGAAPLDEPHRDYAGRTCTTGLLHDHSEGAAPRAEIAAQCPDCGLTSPHALAPCGVPTADSRWEPWAAPRAEGLDTDLIERLYKALAHDQDEDTGDVWLHREDADALHQYLGLDHARRDSASLGSRLAPQERRD